VRISYYLPLTILNQKAQNMNNPLREQLLKSGLVSKDQAKKVDKQAKVKAHQVIKDQQHRKKHPGGKPAAVDTDSVAYSVAKAREEEVARAKELNRLLELDRKQREWYAQARQLVECYHVNETGANDIYNFVDGRVVKPMYVTTHQRKLLANGQLGIVALEGQYYLVPNTIVEKLQEHVPDLIVYFNQSEEETSEADYYAAYPVPDELIW